MAAWLASGCQSSNNDTFLDPVLTDQSQPNFGRSAASLGDLDGDGVPDVAVGTPGRDTGGEDRGALFVLFLDAAGSRKSQAEIGVGHGGFTGVVKARDFFAFALATLGDVDGDGVVDLACGAPGDNDGGTDEGAVRVLFLNTNGTVKSEQLISTTSGGFTGQLLPHDHFGSSVAALGDLDSDGVPDLAVGAPLDDDGGKDQGAVWILFLNPNGTVKARQKISVLEGGFTGSLDADDHFGTSVASLGDVDGDGVPDLAVGGPLDDDGGSARGAVWILFLNANGSVKAVQKISSVTGGFLGPIASHDEFGSSLGALGDRDGDGVPDLAVGAPGDGGNVQFGSVWILNLNADGTVKTQLQIGRSLGGFKGGIDARDRFGSSVVGLPDVDGDAVPDLGVGAAGDGPSGNSRGAFWVLLLNADETVKSQKKTRVD